ncbi:MAG: N-formylglutamate amidohydrolase [Gemmatimonadales bacterium]|jgi:predicted N-formylglutamate amidohydrolase
MSNPPRLLPGSLIVTCEHATNRLPSRYRGLGLTSKALVSHIAWDPGAREVARHFARRFDCPYHEGRYSRLLIDLNRSLRHPKLVPRTAFGVPVPGNRGLSRQEKHERIERYYRPYREAVLQDIERTLVHERICFQLSVHSFTPSLNGHDRRAEIGILYDPARTLERELADRIASALRELGLRVRRNHPYLGTSDGLTTFCRRAFSQRAYVGLEVEINQRLLLPRVPTELKRRLTRGLESALL